jgi:hypothetical protein
MATRSGSSPTPASRRNHAQREADDASPASPSGRQLFNDACGRRCPGCHLRSGRGARCSFIPPPRPERRSDDGQTILKAALEGYRLGSDLGNLVELRGFEPRTSCMPFLAEPSGDVEVSLGLAGQSGYSVWLRPAASEAVCVRSHLISHWYCGPPPQDVRLLANRISSAFMSIETSEAPRQPPKDQSRPAGHSTNYEHGSGMTAQRIIVPMSSICVGQAGPMTRSMSARIRVEALVCGVTG